MPSRVEAGVDFARPADGDVFSEPSVEAGLEHGGLQSRCGIEGGHLAVGVNTGVRAPGKGGARALSGQLLDGGFQRLLDAGVALLQLGAMVGGPVVF